MRSIRFVMLGGFLGAGKTTSLARLARRYQQRGLRVGIVTNDQAADLVDTHTLRAQGFDVGEVAGACFCCRFDQLTETVEQLDQSAHPDVVLAEPVGSCTDLVATVIQPLRHLLGARFDVAPYGVILKPSHGLRILAGDSNQGFSPKAAYIFLKQLEEADFVVINRIDELSAERVERLAALIDQRIGGVPIVRMSATTGQGFDALVEMLEQRGHFGQRVLDIDYDTYAAGEAELGWLNASARLTAEQPFELDRLAVDVVRRLQSSLNEIGAETAHLKTIALAEGADAVANLVSRDSAAVLSLDSGARTAKADLVVNARVAVDPQTLESQVRKAVEHTAETLGAQLQWQGVQSFRPGRPVPTHRYGPGST